MKTRSSNLIYMQPKFPKEVAGQKKITAEKFPNLMKSVSPQIQEAPQT